jgi:hypothetical protein
MLVVVTTGTTIATFYQITFSVEGKGINSQITRKHNSVNISYIIYCWLDIIQKHAVVKHRKAGSDINRKRVTDGPPYQIMQNHTTVRHETRLQVVYTTPTDAVLPENVQYTNLGLPN